MDEANSSRLWGDNESAIKIANNPVQHSKTLLSYVIMKVPSRLPTIQFNILKQNILISGIIFLEIM
jgi:hypothetical protein